MKKHILLRRLLVLGIMIFAFGLSIDNEKGNGFIDNHRGGNGFADFEHGTRNGFNDSTGGGNG